MQAGPHRHCGPQGQAACVAAFWQPQVQDGPAQVVQGQGVGCFGSFTVGLLCASTTGCHRRLDFRPDGPSPTGVCDEPSACVPQQARESTEPSAGLRVPSSARGPPVQHRPTVAAGPSSSCPSWTPHSGAARSGSRLAHRPSHPHDVARRAPRKKPGDAPGFQIDGGEEEDRTPDLCIANAALSQLSYPPTTGASLPNRRPAFAGPGRPREERGQVHPGPAPARGAAGRGPIRRACAYAGAARGPPARRSSGPSCRAREPAIRRHRSRRPTGRHG